MFGGSSSRSGVDAGHFVAPVCGDDAALGRMPLVHGPRVRLNDLDDVNVAAFAAPCLVPDAAVAQGLVGVPAHVPTGQQDLHGHAQEYDTGVRVDPMGSVRRQLAEPPDLGLATVMIGHRSVTMACPHLDAGT